MKKWVISALVYFLVVVGSYYAFTALTDTPANDTEHTNTEQHNQ